MTKQFSETNSLEFEVGGDRQDQLFDVLSHPRRRFALQCLRAAETPLSVEELTTELVAWEVQRPVSDRTGDDRDAIEVSLVHNHLPKMDEAGLVSYDATRQTVTLADRTEEVGEQLRAMTTD